LQAKFYQTVSTGSYKVNLLKHPNVEKMEANVKNALENPTVSM
jgi:hypothetical protein